MKSTNLKASPLGEVLKTILRFAQDDSRRAASVDYRYTKFILKMNLICYKSIIRIASIGCSGSLPEGLKRSFASLRMTLSYFIVSF